MRMQLSVSREMVKLLRMLCEGLRRHVGRSFVRRVMVSMLRPKQDSGLQNANFQ